MVSYRVKTNVVRALHIKIFIHWKPVCIFTDPRVFMLTLFQLANTINEEFCLNKFGFYYTAFFQINGQTIRIIIVLWVKANKKKPYMQLRNTLLNKIEPQISEILKLTLSKNIQVNRKTTPFSAFSIQISLRLVIVLFIVYFKY